MRATKKMRRLKWIIPFPEQRKIRDQNILITYDELNNYTTVGNIFNLSRQRIKEIVIEQKEKK